jgi:mRNA interferase RelE/StbE
VNPKDDNRNDNSPGAISDDGNSNGAPFELVLTRSAQRHLNRLPESVAVAIVEFMLGALVDNPYRVGGLLQRELTGFRSARRGVYRIVYQIDEDVQRIVAHRIDHRSNVCRPN